MANINGGAAGKRKGDILKWGKAGLAVAAPAPGDPPPYAREGARAANKNSLSRYG